MAVPVYTPPAPVPVAPEAVFCLAPFAHDAATIPATSTAAHPNPIRNLFNLPFIFILLKSF